MILGNAKPANAAAWYDPSGEASDVLTFSYYFKSSNNQWEKEPYLVDIRSNSHTPYQFCMVDNNKVIPTEAEYTAKEMSQFGFENGFGKAFSIRGDNNSATAYAPLNEDLLNLYVLKDGNDNIYSLRLCGAATFPLFPNGDLPEEAPISISFELIENQIVMPKEEENEEELPPTINKLDDELTIVSRHDLMKDEYSLSISSEKGKDYIIYDLNQKNSVYEMKNGEFNATSKNKDEVDLNLKNAYALIDGKTYSIMVVFATNEPAVFNEEPKETYIAAKCSLYPAEAPEITLDNPKFYQLNYDKSFTYTGKEISPKVQVFDILNKANLVEGTDYSCKYQSNVNAGKASIIVEGIGKYTGTQTGSFTIAPKSITPSVSLSKNSFNYNGKNQKPSVKVMGIGSLPSSAYSITNQGGTLPGTYKVKVDMKGNYKGSRTVSYTIKLATPTITSIKAGKKNATLKWSKVNGSQYQIQYSLKSNFSNANSKKVANKTHSKKIINLKEKKRYYFRVRNILKKNGKTYYSVWSKKRNCLIKK